MAGILRIKELSKDLKKNWGQRFLFVGLWLFLI